MVAYDAAGMVGVCHNAGVARDTVSAIGVAVVDDSSVIDSGYASHAACGTFQCQTVAAEVDVALVGVAYSANAAIGGEHSDTRGDAVVYFS